MARAKAGTAAAARPKGTAKRAAKGGGAKGADVSRQRNIFVMRGTDAWKGWLDGLAARMGMPLTVLVDHALREVAKRNGHDEPPARL